MFNIKYASYRLIISIRHISDLVRAEFGEDRIPICIAVVSKKKRLIWEVQIKARPNVWHQ